MFYSLGTVPAVLFGHRELGEGIAVVSPWLTTVTSTFLHGGWLHLIDNMLFLWIFRNNVEDAMGHVRFVVFYALCGAAAALAHAAMEPHSAVPLVGASGAIAGVLGAWFALQLVNFGLGGNAGDGIAWLAHIGGFVIGAVLIPVFKEARVPLWGGHRPRGPWG